MNVLLIFYVITLILSLYIIIIKNKLLRFLYFSILSITLFLILSLRKVVYDIGDLKTDLDDYLYYWNSIDVNNFYNAIFANKQSWKGDYVFYFYSWIIKNIYNDYHLFLGITGIISIILFWYSSIKILNQFQLNKYGVIDKYINLFFIFYSISIASFYFLYANVLRQGMAISLWLLSMYVLFKKKYTLSFFVTFIALFIHKSVIVIAIPMYSYYFWKYTKHKLLFILIFLFVILMFLIISIDSGFIRFFYKILWYLHHMTEIKIKDIIQITLLDTIGIYLYFNTTRKDFFVNNVKFLYLIMSIFITFGYFLIPEAIKRFMIYDIILVLLMFSFYVISLIKNRKYFDLFVVNAIIIIYGFFVVTYPSVTILFQY